VSLRRNPLIHLVLAAAVMARLPAGHACATCFGQSDAPMAQGMNWGIMVLLGFIFAVLGAIASFMVFLGRRSAALARAAQASSPV